MSFLAFNAVGFVECKAYRIWASLPNDTVGKAKVRACPIGEDMAAHLVPPMREVEASIYTTAGWVKGTFVIPKMRNFVDFINQPQDYFKLKDVSLPDIDHPLPFFALQQQSVIFIVPETQEEMLRMTTLAGDKVERDVSCAFSNGIVSGALFVLRNARVSDFLMQRHSFFYLRDCSLYLRTSGHPDIRKGLAMIVVNGNRIIGVSEPRIL